MPEPDYKPPARSDYVQQTHWPLNGLLFLLPMLLFFHGGLWLSDTGEIYSLLAMNHLSRLLQFFLGATTPYLPAVAVVVVLLLLHVLRKDPWTFRPTVLVGMAGESAIWMMPLIALVLLVNKMSLPAAALAATEGRSVLPWLLLAVGAGVYEEFIFRLAFIGLAMLLLTKVFLFRLSVIAFGAVVASGVCFSLYHFTAEQVFGSPFPWFEFVFRALAGVYLGLVYLYRGFGIAVGTHAAWDIYVFLCN